ncbi:kinase-like domain-containing protein [Flagelloscypha sp. PMI_526]|nr:kinase-like domain-containing protein [Flagelloscypha sp. PMI_526]
MATSESRRPSQPSVKQSPIAKKFIGAVEDEWQLYSDQSSDYTAGLPIGYGASSIVYAATYHPPLQSGSDSSQVPKPIPVALKVVNLEKLPGSSLALLQRETTLMSLSKHPNVLRVRGSWMNGHKLYIALRLMNKGSAADVMRYGWPGGMEEDVIRCILSQGLEGLNYLHVNGFIHRDVKAANLLIDDDGTVLLGDLGVAADLADDNRSHPRRVHSVSAAVAVTESQGHHVRPPNSRRTSRDEQGKHPCWMAPEVIQSQHYDSAADIWSFGITALELAQGRPPRSRESHKKVLLKTIQDDPPTLDREGGIHKYSRSFKEVVEKCLVKDPTLRPTAAQLLEMPFFKNAKKKSYLVNTVLKDLPPLTTRQERRGLNNTLIHPSVASWDFPTTIHVRSSTALSRRSHGTSVSSEGDESFDLESPVATRHSHGLPYAAQKDLVDHLAVLVDANESPSSPDPDTSNSESESPSDADDLFTPASSEYESENKDLRGKPSHGMAVPHSAPVPISWPSKFGKSDGQDRFPASRHSILVFICRFWL